MLPDSTAAAAPAREDAPVALHRWLVTGLAGGAWEDMARTLRLAWQHDGIELQACAAGALADTLAAAEPTPDGVLLLLATPRQVLEDELPDRLPDGMHDLLEAWALDARAVLHAVRDVGARWVAVPLDRLENGSQSLTAALSAAGLPAWPLPALPVSTHRPWRALAQACADAHEPSARLLAELQAGLIPPAPATATLAPEPPAPSPEEARARVARELRLALAVALTDSRAEVEWLVQQLLQTQAALRQVDQRAAELRRASENTVGIDSREVAQARLVLRGVHDAPPHRHLDLLVPLLRAGDRVIHKLEARLVDHGGRPGLVIFAPPGGSQAISAWAPHGHEAGRPYMLLVPADAAARTVLEHLGTSDWYVVNVLARAVQRDLASGKLGAPPGWGAVAMRLVSSLDELSQRLRYDRLDVQALADGPPGLELTLRHAAMGLRELGDLRLRWCPGGDGTHAVLRLAAPDPGLALPLPRWPVAPDGAPLPWFALPAGVPGAAGRARWRELGEAGQALVLAVMETLHAAARQAPATGGAGVLTRDQLAASARSLNRQARRLHAWVRLRQSLPRWRRAGTSA